MIRAARSLISVVYHMIQALARPRILRYRQAEMQSFRVLVVDDFASFRECVCDVARNAVSGRRASCRWTGRRSESPALPTGLDSPGYRLAEAEWNRGRPADIGCGFWVESSFCISERRPGGGEGSF